jgi:asparagine synthase (glutamine-hydrolysing)
MCGICGFTGGSDEVLLKKMSELIIHRGPDQSGSFSDDKINLAHRRLSILDLSEKGKQPMSNETRNIWISYNGEIYNFKELKKDLAKKGHTFASNTDTEVIIHGYEEEGIGFISKLEGMFAFALWDGIKKDLYLVRDRIGIKPLYYSIINGNLFFASEIKCFLNIPGFKKKLNKQSIHEYLAFQYVPGDKTIFEDVCRVPPGSYIVYDNHITVKQYWELKESENVESFVTAVENTKKILVDSVRKHMISDVPVGVMLSGGLDSSSIVGLLHEQGIKNIKTFSVGFKGDKNELEYAQLVAKKFGTEHHEIIISPGNLVQKLEEIMWYMDEPLADGGAIATFLAGEEIKKHVTVLLVGEGSDEIFAGYSWHRICSTFFLPESVKKRLYFYLTTFNKINNGEMYGIFDRAFPEPSGNFLSRMLHFEITNNLVNNLLMKVDKMTMAHSLEARVPFLDHALVEYACSLKPGYKLKNGGKYILKEVVREILPVEIINRRKHGFIVPLNRWLRNELKDDSIKILLNNDSIARRIFSEKDILDLYKDTRNPLKKIENTSLLWRLLVLEIWRRSFGVIGDLKCTWNFPENLGKLEITMNLNRNIEEIGS